MKIILINLAKHRTPNESPIILETLGRMWIASYAEAFNSIPLFTDEKTWVQSNKSTGQKPQTSTATQG